MYCSSAFEKGRVCSGVRTVDASDIAARNGGGLKTAATTSVWSFSTACFSECRPGDSENAGREDETPLARLSPSPELQQEKCAQCGCFCRESPKRLELDPSGSYNSRAEAIRTARISFGALPALAVL